MDPTRHENREVLISMNHPLWYGGYNPFSPSGETFYQAGILGSDEGTVLQVVRNPGWLLPYVGCVLVAVGMLLHFGIKLIGFLRLARRHARGRLETKLLSRSAVVSRPSGTSWSECLYRHILQATMTGR